MDFHELYEQIWLSEQKAQERKTLLNEVKNDIIAVQKQIQETKESGLSLKRQVEEKLRLLSAKEENVVWFSRRQETLQEKHEAIVNLKTEHQHQLDALQKSNKEERSKFISEITEFSQYYDLTGKGQEERQVDAKQQLQNLKKQEQQLETDIATLVEQQVAVTKDEERKTGLKKDIDGLKSTLQSLVQTSENQNSKTKQLELTKAKISNKPQTDPEFQRLRAELETCRNDTMQGVCQALQQELDRLQRQRWQQQVQRRQPPPSQQNSLVKGQQPAVRNMQSQHSWKHDTNNGSFYKTHLLPPIQSLQKTSNSKSYTNSNKQLANGTRSSGSQFRPIASASNTFTPNPSAHVQSASSAPSVVKPRPVEGKFKPNLAKLRRSVDQQQAADIQENQQPSSSSAATRLDPPVNQAKKVRFENAQWK